MPLTDSYLRLRARLPVYLWPWLWLQLWLISIWGEDEVTRRDQSIQFVLAMDRYGRVRVVFTSDAPECDDGLAGLKPFVQPGCDVCALPIAMLILHPPVLQREAGPHAGPVSACAILDTS